MIEGALNGLYVGLGVGAGLAFSKFVLRPFIEKKIRPQILRFKDHLIRRRYSEDYFRTLSSRELEWADESADKMVADVLKRKKLGIIGGTFYVIIVFLFFLFSLIIFPIITMVLIRVFQFQEPGGALSWYNIEAVGSSTILAIFVGICFTGWVAGSVFMLTKNPNPSYLNLCGRESTHGYWKSVIFDLIRKRDISIYSKPNLVLIGKVPFKRFAKPYGIWTLALSGLVLILLLFDIKNNTVIYDAHIEHSPYRSLSTRTYTAPDVVEVKRICRIIVRAKNQSRPKANLKYKLIMSDGRKVTIYGRDEGASTQKQIRALKHWHEIIPADKFTPVEVSSTHKKEIPATEQGCASVVKCNCSRRNYDDLVRLFDLAP